MEDMLERIRKGELPEHAQKAVVQGIMPLETEALISAIFFICSQNEGLVDEARQTFSGLPDGVKKSYFESPTLSEEILDFYLQHFPLPDLALSNALLNPNVAPATLRDIAATLKSSFLDLIVNNQVKIQEEPDIILELQKNPGLDINQKQKIADYERHLLREIISPAEELENKPIEEIIQEAIVETQDYVRVFGKEKDATPIAPKKETYKEEAKGRVSVISQLESMSVPQKVQAAIKGDREVRSILIREANKMVCCAVIRSPRITDAEVEFYSNLRNVQTDVLRLIASNREWVKSYRVVHNLLKNPRTPISHAIRFLPRLNKRDLQNLTRDRGVSEAIRTMAKRMTRSE